MASLLAELLHDAARRATEIVGVLTDLRNTVPSEVEAYRVQMVGLAERARKLVEGMLADTDLSDPAYATNYFRDYKQVARLVQALENLPVLVLRRFSDADRLMTVLMQAICKEIGFPFTPPICSSISSQYYWTVADMDLVFVPTLEPDHLLGLADLYHELGHIVLYREEKRLVYPALAKVDACYDAIFARGKLANWPAQSLAEVEACRHLWRQAWLLEFASDLIATYLVGPAFGWCNIRTSTNLGGALFMNSDSHPADNARADAIAKMLDVTGHNSDATAIRQRWVELVALSNESAPPRYDLTYPGALLDELARFFHQECHSLGMKAWATNPSDSSSVTQMVNNAWQEVRERPEAFGDFERRHLANLRTQILGGQAGT